jgi:hypothetical protein
LAPSSCLEVVLLIREYTAHSSRASCICAVLRSNEDHIVHLLQSPLSERNVPVGCLGNNLRLHWSIHGDLFQSDLRVQAALRQLGPDVASNCDMRQTVGESIVRNAGMIHTDRSRPSTLRLL